MLSFEKCKELREAGFGICKWDKVGAYCRFYDEDGKVWVNRESRNVELRNLGPAGEVGIPTLEELIVACGEDFKMLISPNAGSHSCMWVAVPKVGLINENGDWAQWEFAGGDTAEEAVANLWLGLNRRKNKQ